MPVSPKAILDQLLSRGSEGEILELKSRKNMSDEDMGKYFSALSNEANLQNAESAWMVFGVDDKTHDIVNSEYKRSVDSINALKLYIADNCTDRMTYRNVYELTIGSNRVLMFEIPPARPGVPTAFKREYYARIGESLTILSTEKYERIMRQTRPDWSSSVIKDAGLECLDPEAISRARENFKRSNPKLSDDCDAWSDETFLNKLSILVNGKITIASVILLGKAEYAYLVPDTDLHIRWILRDSENNTVDGRMFGIPFILAVDEVCSCIRNPTYQFLREGTTVPDSLETYDLFVIREALNNCIAHQDYSKRELVTVVEHERDHIVYVNAGTFIPESVEEVIRNDRPANYYRNPFLMNAMVNLGMVDRMGGGIRRMFTLQKNRMFPMPEYVFDKGDVELTITGHVIDQRFAEALKSLPSLSLEEVILLDKVQKGKELTSDEVRDLREKSLIDLIGKRPVISTIVAKKIDDREIKVQSVLDHGLNNDYYKELIIKLISELGTVSRKDVNMLLMNKLPDALSDDKKYNRITNLIRSLVIEKRIIASGTRAHMEYTLPSEDDGHL